MKVVNWCQILINDYDMRVENDVYLLQLSYYIHRNLLRAGLVKRLAFYTWSSYKPYAYGNVIPKWLNTNVILSQFRHGADKHKAYREHTQKILRHGKICRKNRTLRTK